jgi:hypothetical protein
MGCDKAARWLLNVATERLGADSSCERAAMAADYNTDPGVQARLREFLGGRCLEEMTAHFISGESGTAHWFNPVAPAMLKQFPVGDRELARSLWDRQSLLVDLDMECVNFDSPLEAYRFPERTFSIQRPVVDAIEELLASYGIVPLHLISGRGHHFLWRLDIRSEVVGILAQLGRLPPTVDGKYRELQAPNRERVAKDIAAAFGGVGLVMEFFAHRVLETVASRCEVPLQLTAVEVGPVRGRREIVSLDLSEYGDPLHTRTVRTPFSAYLTHLRLQSGQAGRRLSKLFVVPLSDMTLKQAIETRSDPDKVRLLARRASTQIPEQERGMESLVAAYRSSSLAQFHDYFYNAVHDPPERWQDGYDRTPLDTLPKCAAHILRYPNDLLLRPAGIQHVARTLTAAGWHPRHIAGLIRSKYERDFGWGSYWYVYDAALRADFYTRLFTGLIANGLDPLVDYNCKSTQEKGYCWFRYCGEVLECHRRQILRRTSALNQQLARDIEPAHVERGQVKA